MDNHPLPCYDSELHACSPDIVKEICSSLVTITEAEPQAHNPTKPRGMQLQLAHFTVKEFLLSARLGINPRASIARFKISEEESHKTIALCCMAYLIEVSKRGQANESFAGYPLGEYALKYLQENIIASKEPPEVMKMGVHFVQLMAGFAARQHNV